MGTLSYRVGVGLSEDVRFKQRPEGRKGSESYGYLGEELSWQRKR